MKKIFATLVLLSLLFTSCKSDIQKKPSCYSILIEKGLTPADNVDDNRIEASFLKLLEDNGQIVYLSSPDEFLEKRLDCIKSNLLNGDLTVYVGALYEGTPCNFEKKLPVLTIHSRFYGVNPPIVNGLNNVWEEERFLAIRDNQEENTNKVDQYVTEEINNFLTWFKGNFPEAKIVFYVEK